MAVKIGIIGAGETVGIAHFHAKGILHDGRAEISAVYDLNPENARKFCEKFSPDAIVCGSVEQLLETCDAVNICTPNVTHAAYALQAINAGRNVFVEKPLTISVDQCLPLLEALSAHPVFNMTGFIYRYSDIMRQVGKLIREEIGRIYTWDAVFGGKRLADPSLPLEWRMRRETSGSGALGDFGSHLLDIAMSIGGLKPKVISAMSQTFITERPADRSGRTHVENDDAAVMIAAMENGALATFSVSRVGMNKISLTIAGEGGLLCASMEGVGRITFSPKDKEGAYKADVVEIPVSSKNTMDDWFDNEMSAYIDGLLGLRNDQPDIAYGYLIERYLKEAELSIASSGKVGLL